jgi:flagellar basal-body rod modification protein FlgD
MSSIPATPNSAISSTSGTQAGGNPRANLDTSDFIQLFTAQLQHQDPMSPMDDNAMVTQMSALTSVTQLQTLSASNSQIAASLASSGAVGLLGRTVTYDDANGAAHTGTVEKISTKGGSPALTVSGTDGIDPSSITQVA